MKTREIAAFLGGDLHGDGDIEIVSVASLATAVEGEIAYLTEDRGSEKTDASCVIVSGNANVYNFASTITVSDPKLAFAKLAAALRPRKIRKAEIHRSAVISETSNLGEKVFIGAFVYVGEHSNIGDGSQLSAGVKIGNDVVIGKRCVLHPNVVIEDGCTIGDDVVLHSGVVIGADGFGYVKDENGDHINFPQIGTVVIENQVEIGANSCVDRGAFGETRIGAGTKIDNLVQIAHNVQIGKNCIIVAMSGISGSSVLGDDVVLAGQVGIADHVVIKKGVVIAAKSAVFPNKIISEGVWAGIPARPLKVYQTNFAALGSLPSIRKAIKDLRDRIKSKDQDKTE